MVYLRTRSRGPYLLSDVICDLYEERMCLDMFQDQAKALSKALTKETLLTVVWVVKLAILYISALLSLTHFLRRSLISTLTNLIQTSFKSVQQSN